MTVDITERQNSQIPEPSVIYTSERKPSPRWGVEVQELLGHRWAQDATTLTGNILILIRAYIECNVLKITLMKF